MGTDSGPGGQLGGADGGDTSEQSLMTRSGRPGNNFHVSAPVSFPWEHFDKDKAPKPAFGFLRQLLDNSQQSFARKRATYSVLDWLQVFLPCLSWLRTYKIREYLPSDLVAGLSVGFMVVPQGMSYANLAGLPSVYGLYGAFLPVMAYALVGSSRHLAVGPVAVTSLLIGTSLRDIVPGSENISNPNLPAGEEQEKIQKYYNTLAIQLSFIVACLYTSVGVLHLGFLTSFLSHSVISGFTSGAAITIGLSQLKYILGVSIPRKDSLQEQVTLYAEAIENFKWQEFIMGTLLLAMMVTMKELGKRYKRFKWMRPLGPISACIIGVLAVVIGKVDRHGIKIIGSIPKGLPKPTVDMWFPMKDLGKLMPIAVVVMLVDLLESTSIARALAAKHKYQLEANREITGLGIANFVGSVFNSYTTTGSFSRSAVNSDSGAKTALAGFITAWTVGFVLLFLTPVFQKLPYNVLGAIILSAIVGLLDYEQAVYLWRVRKLDWFVWMASFLGTLFISIEIGLGISIGLALLIVIYESAFPHTALLGHLPNSTVYRNVKQYPQAQVLPGIMVVRIDSPIYFANLQYIRDRLRKYEDNFRKFSADRGVKLQYAILDLSPVTHVDAPAIHAFETWIEDFSNSGMQTILCNPNRKVISLLEIAGVPDMIGRDLIFVSVHDAVNFAQKQMAENGTAVAAACMDRPSTSASSVMGPA